MNKEAYIIVLVFQTKTILGFPLNENLPHKS